VRGIADDILSIDLTAQSFMRDHTLDQMREAGPVVRVKLPFLGKTWLATTHAPGCAGRHREVAQALPRPVADVLASALKYTGRLGLRALTALPVRLA
jgi:hypothetical protein